DLGLRPGLAPSPLWYWNVHWAAGSASCLHRHGASASSPLQLLPAEPGSPAARTDVVPVSSIPLFPDRKSSRCRSGISRTAASPTAGWTTYAATTSIAAGLRVSSLGATQPPANLKMASISAPNTTMPRVALSVLRTMNTQMNAAVCIENAASVALMAALPRYPEKAVAIAMAPKLPQA